MFTRWVVILFSPIRESVPCNLLPLPSRQGFSLGRMVIAHIKCVLLESRSVEVLTASVLLLCTIVTHSDEI